MCLHDENYVELATCTHGSLHLRVGNTTLHLTREQVLRLHHELIRCIRRADDDASPRPRRMDPFIN